LLYSHTSPDDSLAIEVYLASGNIYFYYTNDNWITMVESHWVSPVQANIWQHVALVRSSTDLLLFVGGVLQTAIVGSPIGTISFDAIPYNVQIGKGYNEIYFDGYMDELRISKGIARWTSNFTPPVLEYTV
jgi:hypothetical protein